MTLYCSVDAIASAANRTGHFALSRVKAHAIFRISF